MLISHINICHFVLDRNHFVPNIHKINTNLLIFVTLLDFIVRTKDKLKASNYN